MGIKENFFDVLFEISSEDRYRILLQLSEGPKRVTQLARILGLGHTEISRHISRICDVKLAGRDADGLYRLTPYGEVVLEQLQGFEFTSRYREYFASHSLSGLPNEFVNRIGDLSDSTPVDNVMDFLHFVESGIKEAKEYIWLQVDRFPMTALSSIIEMLKQGVRYRIIEPRKGEIGPFLNIDSSEEMNDLVRTRHTPLVEQRTIESVCVYLFISDDRCAFAFPITDSGFDYKGFKATDENSLKWCMDLFNHYWEGAEPRVYISPTEHVRPTRMRAPEVDTGQIIVEGRDDPLVDAQAVQEAVNHYDEVILRGTFNFGVSSVLISRSVVIRGEGRENDVPETIIYKKSWSFPFREFDCVLRVEGEGANVTIENLHFTDFNNACIWGHRCNNLNIKNNRITLPTGYGRGITFGAFGDLVLGIWVEGLLPDHVTGKVTIERNYIDFASTGSAWGGHLSRGGLEEDPEYRPDLFNHEYYIGVGIFIGDVSGKVSVENNIIRNANGRGISAFGGLPSMDVRIRHNTIVSDVYGSYPFSSPEAGAGILAQCSWSSPRPGFNVEIEGNTIKFDKLNHCGIKVLGPATDQEGAEKLRGGIIRNNRIQLKNGYEGIHVRKCDDFEVADNKISGEAYYGIRISGRRRSGELDLRALNNLVEGNDMDDLRIREPDEYSDSHVDGRMFTGSKGKSATAHVWLNTHSKGNVINIKADETAIDEGEDNITTHIENEETS